MYSLKRTRSRKPVSHCSPGHKSLIKKIYSTACINDILQKREQDDSVEKVKHDLVATNEEMTCTVSDLSEPTAQAEHHLDSALDFDMNGNSIPDADQDLFSNEYEDEESSIQDSNSSDSDSESSDNVQNFESSLAKVFMRTNMTHEQSKTILKVCRTHACFWEQNFSSNCAALLLMRLLVHLY